MIRTRCGNCRLPLSPDDVFCGNCGAPADKPPAGEAVALSRPPRDTSISVHDVVRSQIAVGDGNVQIQVTVDGASQFGQLEGGVALRVREIPVLATAGRPNLVGRDELIDRVSQDLSNGTSVQLFGAVGVGRTAVAEAVLRRLAAARVRGVELLPGNQPHTLESLYRRLVDVFFGVTWYQPEEAVLRLEVARAGLRALIVITDCDLTPENLGRLVGSFPSCTFLLTSRQQTLAADAGAAYEVDPLTPGQARELITRTLGAGLSGLQNLQWDEAYRLADGQIQRLMEHAAFIKRVATRPGQTDRLLVPLTEQVAMLIAGLTEPARRVLVAMSTYELALTPAVFGAVTGLPEAVRTTDELLNAGLVSGEGRDYRIAPDAAAVLADGTERSDPRVAAEGLTHLLATADPPDPQLLLAVARMLHSAGHDAQTSTFTRSAAPAALAAGEIGVWVNLVALGVQAATSSRRTFDLEFFLNEQHTGALLRGDTIAAAAALAALGELLSEQHAPAGGPHTGSHTGSHAGPHTGSHIGPHTGSQTGSRVGSRSAKQAGRLIRHGHRGLSAGHRAALVLGGAGAVGLTAVIAAVVATSGSSAPPRLTGSWNDAGAIFDFVATGPDTYTASELTPSAPQCKADNDVKVTGSNGHYRGTAQIFNLNGGVNGGCDPVIGTATITIDIAANGATARVNIVGNNCSKGCGPQTWTRKSAS